ncbi:hypothetical protein TNCV_474881 [Trichonephila clavipes]|nr:hypothetical protein TNCV_474881 [Trichonephila clavipes]
MKLAEVAMIRVCQEILYSSSQRLIHKRIQVAPEAELHCIEILRAWKPSNRFDSSNQPQGYVTSLVRIIRHCYRMKCNTRVLSSNCLGQFARCFYSLGTLHTCKFLQPYHDNSNPYIRLATPLFGDIVLPIATIISIFTN